MKEDRVLKRENQKHLSKFLQRNESTFHTIVKPQRIIGNGSYGNIFSCDMKGDNEIVIKGEIFNLAVAYHDKYSKTVETSSTLREYSIGRQLNELNCDNFVYTYAIVTCPSIISNHNRKVICWNKSYDNLDIGEPDNVFIRGSFADRKYIVLEKLEGETLCNFLSRCVLQDAIICFQQIIFSLYLAYKKFKYNHNDLHYENVIIAKTKNEVSSYEFDSSTVSFKNHGLRVVIIDNGYACCYDKNNKFIGAKSDVNDVSNTKTKSFCDVNALLSGLFDLGHRRDIKEVLLKWVSYLPENHKESEDIDELSNFIKKVMSERRLQYNYDESVNEIYQNNTAKTIEKTQTSLVPIVYTEISKLKEFIKNHLLQMSDKTTFQKLVMIAIKFVKHTNYVGESNDHIDKMMHLRGLRLYSFILSYILKMNEEMRRRKDLNFCYMFVQIISISAFCEQGFVRKPTLIQLSDEKINECIEEEYYDDFLSVKLLFNVWHSFCKYFYEK